MRTLKFTIFVIFCFILSDSSNALDTISVKYYPLAIGNTFVYNYRTQSNFGPITEYNFKYSILRDTIINNKKYFLRFQYPQNVSQWVRTDTTTGSMYAYDSTNNCPFYEYEKIIDSLAANPVFKYGNCNSGNYTCSGIISDSAFGFSGDSKIYSYFTFSPHYTSNGYKTFLNGIGHFKSHGEHYNFSTSGWHDLNLLGCVVNGITYGDTTLVGINNINSEIPKSFSIYQNYPNPFNPTTNIKFDVPYSSFVKISVFNVIWKEVEQIVNENLLSGSYEVNWDGSNYPSGVYYYRLQADGIENFIVTKSMLLMK